MAYVDVAAMRDDSSGAEPADAVDDYEWVNAWAAQAAEAAAVERRVMSLSRAAAAPDGDAAQLARDIAEIERVRDALLAARAPKADPPKVVRIEVWSHLRRTADSVPLILGSVVGMLMLVVFSAAAAFVRLAR